MNRTDLTPPSRAGLARSPSLQLRQACLVAVATLAVLGSASAWGESLISQVQVEPVQTGTALSVQSNGRPAYDVNTYNGGYRVRINFQDAHFLPSVGVVSAGGAVENVLAKNSGRDAHLDLLLSTPQAVMVQPTATGYRIGLVPDGNPGTATAGSPAMAAAAPSAAAVQPATLPVFAGSTQIRNLSFQRENSGAGVLSLAIGGAQPRMNVTRENGRLVVALRNTGLPASLVHRFGVSQFGTPVQYVDAYPMGHSTRLVFHINGPFQYSAYQLGQRTMISVRRQSAQTRSGNPANSARLSMDFQNISVRDALQVIADFTHQNIVVSNSVGGSLSIRLKNEPWKEAFRVILESQGLAVKHVGNILWVAPAGQIASQDQAELQAAASRRKLEPLVTELIPLKYARARQIAHLLEGFSRQINQESQTGLNPEQSAALAGALGVPSTSLIGNSLLGPRGSVAVVTRTNSLLVRDTPDNINNIRRLIEKIDRPVPQVLIEARIVQIDTNAAQSLGIQWGGTYTSAGAGGMINLAGTSPQSTSSLGSTPGGTGTSGSSTSPTDWLVNLPAYAPAGSALTGFSPASLGFQLGNAVGSRVLNLQLQALQASNRAKIISSPKVLTEDNEKAVIAQGQEIPYQQAASSGATAVSFKKAELSLRVTPHIAPNGKISMNVEATNNQPNYAQTTVSGVPIDTQEVKTKLLVNNGQTIVIGGIYTENKSHYDTGVPLLQNIPLLGWLFKSRNYNDSQTELLVFITPKIVGGGVDSSLAGNSIRVSSGS